MSSQQKLISGISQMYGDNKSTVEPSENEQPAVQKKPRTFLTGRRRKDDPRPLKTKDDERTSFIVNKQQYAKVRAIALQESMTIKDLVYEMFKLGIERYEKRHGPVEVRNEKTTDLF